MPAGGFADYVNVMMALPGTATEIAERTGMGDSGVRRLLRSFWWLKIVHPGGKRSAGQRHPCEAIWLQGEGTVAEGLRVGKPMRSRQQHIAFAYLWRALQDGATKLELREATGMSAISVQRALNAMGSSVHVAEYERDALGRPYPVWQAGNKRNKPKPAPPTEGDKWRAYQQRKRFRLMSHLAGVSA